MARDLLDESLNAIAPLGVRAELLAGIASLIVDRRA
jgi:hypothetical protein